MFSTPTLKPLALPLRRAPPRIGTSGPSSSRPMRRLKKRSSSSPLPTVNSPEFSRKNGRFSGKAQVEAREIDLLRVDFDLREVGVVGHVEVQARRDAELRVEAEVAVEVGLRSGREVPVGGADDVGQQLEVARRLELEPAQLAGRRQAAQVVDRAAAAPSRSARACAGCCGRSSRPTSAAPARSAACAAESGTRPSSPWP